MSPALAYAHLQLRGGWKNLAITTGIYSFLLMGVIFVSTRFNPAQSSVILAVWVKGLLGLQAALLLLLGCGTINAAVRTDLTEMIESHRLMPVHPASAIAGYLTGATCQATILAGATFLIGLSILRGASVTFERWLVPHIVLGCFALFLWVVTLFAAFCARTGILRWAVGLVAIPLLTQGMVLALLPGLALLVSPMFGDTLFAMRMRHAQFSADYALACVGQLVIGGICFLGACRKFRRADALALGTWLSLALLAAWVGLSALGMSHWDAFRPSATSYIGGGMRMQFVSSMIVTLVLAIAPAAAAAWENRQWQLRRELADPHLPRRPVPTPLALLLSSGVVIALAYWARETLDLDPVPALHAFQRTALLTFCFIFSVGYLLRILYHTGVSRAWLLAGIFIFLTGVGPLLIDLIRYARLEDDQAQVMGSISSASPVGALILLWNERRWPIDTTPGLIFQGTIALALIAAYYLTANERAAATMHSLRAP